MSRVIICINGEDHKRHRKLMMPAFSRAAIDGYADETVRITEAIVGTWPIGATADLAALLRTWRSRWRFGAPSGWTCAVTRGASARPRPGS